MIADGLFTLSDEAAKPPVLAPTVWADINQVIQEHRLAAGGQLTVQPTRTLLMTGPPGSGKTMTAAYLAASLGRPLLTLNLAATVASELGQTGSNIRRAFLDAAHNNAVLFIDELDAIAARRTDASDVGEARRMVNVLLLELDRWPAGPLLLAATNHPDLLDPAVWRRFEVVVELGLPSLPERQALIARTLDELGLFDHVPPPIVDAVAAATQGLSAADTTPLVNRAARKAEVQQRPLPTTLLQETLEVASRGAPEAAELLYVVLNDEGMSFREIAKLFNTSHPTVSAAAARGRRRLGGSKQDRDR